MERGIVHNDDRIFWNRRQQRRLKPKLEQFTVGRAVVDDGSDDPVTAFRGNDVCPPELPSADRAEYRRAAKRISVFTVQILVQAAFVNVIQLVFRIAVNDFTELGALLLVALDVFNSFFCVSY